MPRLPRELSIVALLLLPAVAAAAEIGSAVVITPPTFPQPLTWAVIGLSLTAVVAVAARTTQRTAGTMMYMVLATIAVTASLIATSHRIHSRFNDEAQERLNQIQRAAR
jgi:hypothetical protein